MTQTRTPLAAKILLVLAVVFFLGTLCWIAVDNTQRHAPQPAQPEVTEQADLQRIDAIPAVQPLRTVTMEEAYLTGLAEDADFTEAQAQRLTEAGHLVCDGFTADVPVAVMTSTLMDQYALTGPEAMTLVNQAGVTLCR